MQSPDIDDTNGDNNNKLITANNETTIRPKITMIPESFTSSDTEDDVKHQSATLTENNNETLRAWFQRITQMQNEIQKNLTDVSSTTPSTSSATTTSSVLQSRSSQIQSPPQRIVNYQDLPYMGEMTLDNSKPRRGRKPKKADICHLIYKNYGTIFPGTPNSKIADRNTSSGSSDATKKQDNVHQTQSNSSKHKTNNDLVDGMHRSDVQHRIISSLLEKRLTQESKRQQQLNASASASNRKSKSVPVSSQSKRIEPEPLNLCMRDLDHLKIQLNHLNFNLASKNTHLINTVEMLSKQGTKVEIKEEPGDAANSDDDVEFVHETPSPASSNCDFKFPAFPPELLTSTGATVLPQDVIKTPENGVPPGGYVYWPHAGVFIHPAALQQQLLYYQKMTGTNTPGDGDNAPSPMELPIKLLPKAPLAKSKSSTKSETSEDEVENKTKRHGNLDRSALASPAKRKRSAIFIPPIPSENQNNPATEVSICKFKFTGGAKPSLQEKKMLSVDSGGNFRYYSGTGDKSMRGYEFFPRETLQQQVNNAQGSSTGAFLQASGERVYPSSPVDFTSKVNEFMLTPELKPPQEQPQPVADTDACRNSKKRKSRKSLQREKLEQTFKEKGFLIQTQQLESAEGATYCKFRQLRKFTRYLFRSWKDYLPGNVGDNQHQKQPRQARELPDVEEIGEDPVALLGEPRGELAGHDHESVSNLSSPRTMHESTSSSPL